MQGPKILVLMSVYNETYDEIYRAVKSIVDQTYKNFIFTIIVDNPKSKDIINSIEKICKNLDDSRIKILYNDENMGLARSMNQGFKYWDNKIEFDYIARMDADDKSHIDRFQLQINEVMDDKYDIVYTDCNFVDEEGQHISSTFDFVTSDKISSVLPVRSAIIHPTVMIKSAFFRRIGGYRQFPSAQDYDFWLRSVSAGARFIGVNKKLLDYTVRELSVSRKNLMQQEVNSIYIRKLYKERQRTKKNSDSFSQKRYEQVLLKYGVFDDRKQEKYLKNKKIQEITMDMISQRKSLVINFVKFVYVTLSTKILRNKFIDGLKYRMIR